MDYATSGVDIASGDAFARHIASINSPAIRGGIGGFAGASELDLSGYSHPVLLSATDGVGTKLLVAQRLGEYSTIGIDLVAMSVNDLLVSGARPVQFLDYIACGKLSETPLHAIIEGVVKGCELAGCELAGGETAEMPDVYDPGEFDLAGFATGIAERDHMWPHSGKMTPGDVIYGVPSSGVHSNGLSLARKALADSPEDIWRKLLTPTRIYAPECEVFRQAPGVLGAAHITGGGLSDNISRVLPDGLRLAIHTGRQVPEIFAEIQHAGTVPDQEMNRVFNMGVGLAVVVASDKKAAFEQETSSLDISIIGEVSRG